MPEPKIATVFKIKNLLKNNINIQMLKKTIKFVNYLFYNFICCLITKKKKIMSDIADKVKAIIVDNLGVDAAEVVEEASFTNDLGADSLDTVELIMEFEKEFDIQIPDDKAEAIATVGDAVNFIKETKG